MDWIYTNAFRRNTNNEHQTNPLTPKWSMLHPSLPVRIISLRPHISLLSLLNETNSTPKLFQLPEISLYNEYFLDLVMYQVRDLVLCLGLSLLQICSAFCARVLVKSHLCDVGFESFSFSGKAGEGVGCGGVEFELFHSCESRPWGSR